MVEFISLVQGILRDQPSLALSYSRQMEIARLVFLDLHTDLLRQELGVPVQAGQVLLPPHTTQYATALSKWQTLFEQIELAKIAPKSLLQLSTPLFPNLLPGTGVPSTKGSILTQLLNETDSKSPDLEKPPILTKEFETEVVESTNATSMSATSPT